jgi:hypothetical protein
MASSGRFRRHGLYYPYFHVRDDRWLKVAALYWPGIIRLVPPGYTIRDSGTARALVDVGFIDRQPPGKSVAAVADRFVALVAEHGGSLRAQLRLTPYDQRMASLHNLLRVPEPGLVWRHSTLEPARYLGLVHTGQVHVAVKDAFVEAGLAVVKGSRAAFGSVGSLPQQYREAHAAGLERGFPASEPYERAERLGPTRMRRAQDPDEWLVMDERLVSVYMSALADDFATANRLQLTTDRPRPFVAASDWPPDRLAAALLDSASAVRMNAVDGELTETLAFLALDLVVPDNLDGVPISKIIEVRERYGQEFRAFGEAIDQAAEDLADLADVRDPAVLERYLHQEVVHRFAQPTDELRKQLGSLRLDAATMAINVKTALPAGVALAAGGVLSGQPVVAGGAAAALGLLAIRRSVRQQRDAALRTTQAASYLLHTREQLQPRSSLDRTLARMREIAGTYNG